MAAVLSGKFSRCGEGGQRLTIDFAEQKPGGSERVIRLAFNARARGENHRLFNLLRLRSVVEVLERFLGELARTTDLLNTPTRADEPPPDTRRLKWFA